MKCALYPTLSICKMMNNRAQGHDNEQEWHDPWANLWPSEEDKTTNVKGFAVASWSKNEQKNVRRGQPPPHQNAY